ncbi:MAG: hypothetical protein WD530_08230, partial [Vicingaceae bacterium]
GLLIFLFTLRFEASFTLGVYLGFPPLRCGHPKGEFVNENPNRLHGLLIFLFTLRFEASFTLG